MMRKYITFALLAMLFLPLYAQRGERQQLHDLYQKAMKCYLIDDYQQLDTYISRYSKIYDNCAEMLGDSADVFEAYLQAMQGAYNYSFADELLYAYLSEEHYTSSLDVFRRRNSSDNVAVLREELAQLYYKIREYHSAKLQLDSVFSYYDDLYNGFGITDFAPHYYRTMSQLAICNAHLGNFDLAVEQINTAVNDFFHKKKNPDYYEALRKQGKILMMQADEEGSTNYRQAAKCYKKYVDTRCSEIEAELERMNGIGRDQHWLSIHQFLYDCYRLGNHAPDMLYDLALFSKDFLVRRDAKRTTWKQVQKSITKDECAVEFVQYFGRDDEKRMGCMVLSREGKPHFIDLFSVDSLLYSNLGDSYWNIGNAIMSLRFDVKNTLYTDKSLPATIWTYQLMEAIGDARKVYFAPDGLLNQLAIEYIIPDTTKICYRLSSTRNLVQRKHKTAKLERMLICGGVEYNAYYRSTSRNNDAAAYRAIAPYVDNILYLPNSLTEVDSIYALRNNPQDKLLTDEEVTDENFLRLLADGYDAVHISTHGIFDGIIDIFSDLKPLHTDVPMSKSALLMAGCVSTLSDNTFDQDLYDGILSAKEISQQDMSGVELIVLSACQTGQGRLTDDGIYGLQRSLKQAGAQAMILSLWPVDDYASYRLMHFFYDELQKQSDESDMQIAFQHARKRLMNESRYVFDNDSETLSTRVRKITYNLPQYACPFILIDSF